MLVQSLWIIYSRSGFVSTFTKYAIRSVTVTVAKMHAYNITMFLATEKL